MNTAALKRVVIGCDGGLVHTYVDGQLERSCTVPEVYLPYGTETVVWTVPSQQEAATIAALVRRGVQVRVVHREACRTSDMQERVRVADCAARHALYPAATWFTVTARELPCYDVAAAADTAGAADLDKLLAQHPAFPAMSFLDVENALADRAAVLADILDIRMFMHPVRPLRISRLAACFGVMPHTVGHLLRLSPERLASGRVGAQLRRGVHLLRCWAGLYPWDGGLDNTPLMRLFIGEERSFTEAFIAASRMFLRMLSSAWYDIAGYIPDAVSGVRFPDGAMTQAFQRHVRACREKLCGK